MPIDLTEALTQLREGRCDARTLLSHSLERARSPACERVFIRTFFDEATAAAAQADACRASGQPLPALGGLAVSVKDLFDVAGHPTTAASATLADAPAALADAPAVARLRRAGAALIGHTQLSEFAFSGVGMNPHWGTPLNPVTRVIDGRDRIPGGSTSGGAVSVATGAAWAALGTDTGGSLRIPAALQGLVGFKSTARCVPLDGCVPLSPSLDTAGAISRSVRDAALLHGLLAAQALALTPRGLAQRRLLIVTELMQDELEPAVAQAFDRALHTLSAAGARIEERSVPAMQRISELQAGGGLPAYESWQWHQQRLATRGDDYDPRVALRIRRGQTISSDQHQALLDARRRWIHDMTLALNGFDAVISPTVPMQAPEIAPLQHSDETFFATNARLLRNPSVVNLLDGCALSLPCHRPNELPIGLMLWRTGGHDAELLSTAAEVEAALTSITEAH